MGAVIVWFFDLVHQIFLLMKSFKIDLFGYETSIFHISLAILLLSLLIGLFKLIIPIAIGYDMNSSGDPYIEDKAHFNTLGTYGYFNKNGGHYMKKTRYSNKSLEMLRRKKESERITGED